LRIKQGSPAFFFKFIISTYYKIHYFKSIRLCNSKGNVWSRSNGNVTISEDGLNASKDRNGRQHVYAKNGFPISVAECRSDDFPGTICYYYEVKSQSKRYVILINIQ
jgi:hypothetical protein